MLFAQQPQVNMQLNEQFNKMAEYIRDNWNNCIRANSLRIPQQMQYALQNHLNGMINQWASILCNMLNSSPGTTTTQVLDQTILGWYQEAVNMLSSGIYPQRANNYAPNMMGQGYVVPTQVPQVPMMRQQMGFGGYMGGGNAFQPIGAAGSILDASNEMYADDVKDASFKRMEPPKPVVPMGNVPSQAEVTPIVKQAEEIKPVNAIPSTRNSYKLPSRAAYKEVTFKLPVAGKGYIETLKIDQGNKLSKKLFIELDKYTDNVRGVLEKLKKKYSDVDQIIIKYRSLDLVKCPLADLQQAFRKVKELHENESENFSELNKQIIEVLDSKPKSITKQIESIVLEEYNNLIKHFVSNGVFINSLDELLTNDQCPACYVNAALDLIKTTMIFDPASSEMSPYLSDYEIEDGKTYKDLRKSKDKFLEWAKEHAVVISHTKVLRYTKIFDVEPSIFCSIATGIFEIGYEDDGSPLSCDFEFFLYDEVPIDTSIETMLVQNGGSIYEIHLARQNQIDKMSNITKQISLRND